MYLYVRATHQGANPQDVGESQWGNGNQPPVGVPPMYVKRGIYCQCVWVLPLRSKKRETLDYKTINA